MSVVYTKYNESIDSLLRRFKKAVDRSGILTDLKKHEFYEKPSVRRKRKSAIARKRTMKKQRKVEQSARPTNQNFKWNRDKTEKIYSNPKSKQNFNNKSNKPYNKNNFNKQNQR